MKQSTPPQTIRALAHTLEGKQAEIAAALLNGNRLFQQPIRVGGTELNACIFAARSIHFFPIESYELMVCEPFQVAIHTQQGLGVLVWRNFAAVSRPGQSEAMSDGTARFVSLDQCCPDIQYIAGAELPFLLVAVEHWITAEISRQS
jgi:hypothetical protein